MLRFALILALALPSLGFGSEKPVSGLTAEELERATFSIEDSRCYIGIAAVKLSVSELKHEDGKLVGDYTIRVPLKCSKNDQGRIVLDMGTSFEELGSKGGILYGKAYSDIEGTPPHEIVCEIRPHEDAAILLAITTSDRTINFESRYQVNLAANDG